MGVKWERVHLSGFTPNLFITMSAFLNHLAAEGATFIHPLGKYGTALLWHALAPEAGDQLLEIGCGTGHTLTTFNRHAVATFTGCDISPSMLAQARKRLSFCGLANEIPLHQLSGTGELPFPDEHFDRVYCESVLAIMDTATLRKNLQEIFRVLKPGGRFFANESIWRTSAPQATIEQINALCVEDFGLIQANAEIARQADWQQAFAESGLTCLIDAVLQNLPKAPLLSDVPRSRLFTFYYKLRTRLLPRYRKVGQSFAERIHRHAEHGRQIESRLFVLEKPAGSVSKI